MSANVDPENEVFLLNVLPVKEHVEIHRWSVRQVKVPHAAGGWFGVFPLGHCKVVGGPVGIIEETSRLVDVLSTDVRKDSS